MSSKTTEPLALKYRPQSFGEMIGQKITAAVLNQMVQTKQVPTGMLFSGVRGGGKTSAARILGRELKADVIEVDAASNGSVDSVRTMIDNLRYTTSGEARLVIYDEAHSMSREAFNALLKTLEEPPIGVLFVLITTEPEKIPETVKSRLMEFVFNKVSASDIYDRLSFVVQDGQLVVQDDLLVLISERADGSVRDALMLLDQCSRAGIESVSEFMKMANESDDAPELILALMSGDHSKIFSTVDSALSRSTNPNKIADRLISAFRDMLILRSGGTLSLGASSIEARRELAVRLEAERILAAMKLLWDLKTRIRTSSDSKGNLDLVLVLVSEIFTRGKQLASVALPVAPAPVIAPPTPPVEERLSLDDM